MIGTYVIADGAVLLNGNPKFTDLHGIGHESIPDLPNLVGIRFAFVAGAAARHPVCINVGNTRSTSIVV